MEIPRKYKALYDKHKRSRKAAIRIHCLECVGYSEKEVKLCTDERCSLWKWRIEG